MRLLPAIASGLLALLGALQVLILWVMVLIATPLIVAGILVMRLQNRRSASHSGSVSSCPR